MLKRHRQAQKGTPRLRFSSRYMFLGKDCRDATCINTSYISLDEEQLMIDSFTKPALRNRHGGAPVPAR